MTDYASLIKSVLTENKQINDGSSYISLWRKYYAGYDPAFHRYYIFNGDKKIYFKKKTLNMAKRACEEWASLLMNEKVKIVASSENDQKLLDQKLDKIHFWAKANKGVEYGFALSYDALLIELKDIVANIDGTLDFSKSKATIQTYSALQCIPITFENNEITEIAFVQKNTNETQLLIHYLNDQGNYSIAKIKIDSNGVAQKSFDLDTQSPKKWFQIIQPNIVNNIDVDSPYPISVFANAISVLQSIDDKYDSYDNEFVLGKKRVYISSEIFEVDKETGEMKKLFDPNDVVIHRLPKSVDASGQSKPLIQTSTDALRAVEHQVAINDDLALFSSAVGLGNGYFIYKEGRIMTATQVISEKSDTFRNVKKHEILLYDVVKNIIETYMWVVNQFTDEEHFTQELIDDVKFDDSIIEDKETEKKSDREDVTNGVMSKIEYRVKWFGETEEQATAMIIKYFGNVSLENKINTCLAAMGAGLMTIQQFVDNVYPDSTEKQKLIDELLIAKKEASSISLADVQGAGFYSEKK
ncbi:MAG: hypothetical protein WC366_05335 [Bacilli bacterium]|jgi:hypothetical protein